MTDLKQQAPIFITGTDTGIGKTVFMTALIHALQQQDKSLIALKPVASGAEMTADGLRNEDVIAYQQVLTQPPAYEVMNPWCFAERVSPNIADDPTQPSLGADAIIAHCQKHAKPITLIEGVGGWQVPINPHETMADVAVGLRADVILVVGIRLGCLNHSRLTVESILRYKQVRLLGWVANHIDPHMSHQAENIQILKQAIPAPLLLDMAYQTQIEPQRFSAQMGPEFFQHTGLTNE